MMRRSRFKSAIFALLVLLLLFVLAEGTLRLLDLNTRVDNPLFMLVRVYEYPEYFEKDHGLFWRLRENIEAGTEFLVEGSYRTNSLGLRGAEADLADLGNKTRIACFGNSCTFGWELEENQTYPALLGEQLGNEYVGFNCGVPGYSSFQGFELLKHYEPILKPDIVTICYGWNDHWAAGFDIEDKAQEMPAQWLLDIQNLLSRSYLYRTAKYLLLAKAEKKKEYTYDRESPTYRVSLQDYRSNLIEMVRYCRQRKIKAVLLTAPIGNDNPNDQQPYEIYHELYNQMVREVSREYRVTMLNAAVAFVDHPEFFDNPAADYIHYNTDGARWIADHLASAIKRANR
jgi:lysophospholipase L1-like esterase